MAPKKSVFLSTVLFILILFLCVPAVFAASKSLGNIGGSLSLDFMPLIGSDIDSSAGIVNLIVSVVLGVLTTIGGVMFLVMFFLGGIGWLSAGGNKESVDQAKRKLTNSAIGLAIVVAAYGLTYILGNMLNIDILNAGSYLYILGPDTKSDFIQSIASLYSPFTDLNSTAETLATSTGSKANQLFAVVLGAFTLFAGIFFVIYFLMGALQWVSSGGVPESIEKAKKQISSALIGLIVVIAAYSISVIIGSVFGLDILNPGKTLIQVKNPIVPIPTTCPPCGGYPCCDTCIPNCGGSPCCGECLGGHCAY